MNSTQILNRLVDDINRHKQQGTTNELYIKNAFAATRKEMLAFLIDSFDELEYQGLHVYINPNDNFDTVTFKWDGFVGGYIGRIYLEKNIHINHHEENEYHWIAHYNGTGLKISTAQLHDPSLKQDVVKENFVKGVLQDIARKIT